MSSTLPTLHYHPRPLETLAPYLIPYLPYSFPLLRRLQFTYSSPEARVLSTLPPSHDPTTSPPFCAAYAQRSANLGTDSWLFSTFESHVPSLPPFSSLSTHQSNPSSAEARRHILSVLNGVAQAPSPNSSDGKRSQHLLIGSVNDSLLPLLSGKDTEKVRTVKVISLEQIPSTQRNGEEDPEGQGKGAGAGWRNVLSEPISVPYIKYLIPPFPSPGPAGISTQESLPPGYSFDSIRDEELDLVIAATDIPRQKATLALYGSVGVRFQGELIAWAFISCDGCLSSLHVRSQHRRKGLARAICRHLFALLDQEPEQMGFRHAEAKTLFDDGEGSGGVTTGEWGPHGWASSVVAEDNEGGRRVAESVGGRGMWSVRWLDVDLGVVKQVAEEWPKE